MTERHGLKVLTPFLAAIVCVCQCSTAAAQLIKAPLTDGFVRTSSIDISVDEMLGSAKQRAADEPLRGPGYPALWIAEIQYKPVRLVRMPVDDPRTGKSSRELVWYMVYRLIPRDYTELAGEGRADLVRKLEDPERDPANVKDPVVANSLQMPRFLLRTEDQGAEQEYLDEVNLQIQKAVFLREMGRKAASLKLHNSVEAITEVQEPVSSSDPDPLARAIYGVAVWRNVDPKTDYFTIYMSGLTNAYQITMGEGGARTVEEKVVMQKFARPGDEFLQEEKEFRLNGDPEWLYRVRKADLQVPELDTILRNARKESAPTAEQ